MMLMPSSPEPEATSSVEPKKPGKSMYFKMCLIGWIVADYFIDLFNRNSRDYREVSGKLAQMKSEDKITQQEDRIRARTNAETVNNYLIILNK
jgi:hypothetical protein